MHGEVINKRLENGIQIYTKSTHSVTDEQIEYWVKNWFCEQEKDKYSAFRSSEDRRLYAVAHGLTRFVLSRCASIAPQNWRFRFNEYGKPEIANALSDHLYFNLSHTKGLAVCALSRHQVCGVDVELAAKLDDLEQVAQEVYSPQELDSLFSLKGSERLHRFYWLWTHKEAFIKACGIGMSLPLKTFSIEGEKNNCRMVFHPGFPGDHEQRFDASRWGFYWSLLDKRYQLTVSSPSWEICQQSGVHSLDSLDFSQSSN
ncbi:MAG TPA: hypothetical protein DCZ03_10575 [Gammaproteobacteria bacterium]|nr:hypothetical protein [Gammaproteobacteria bacterium]